MKELFHQIRLLIAEWLISIALDITPECPEGVSLAEAIHDHAARCIQLRAGNGE